MLLRRFSEHISDQNWVAVGLDFLVVVAGIFVGLQVDDWNTSRQQHILERQYLEAIVEDLNVDIESYAFTGEVTQAVAEDVDYLFGVLGDDNLLGDDFSRLPSSIRRASYAYFPVINRTTYDELISTGNLALLRDKALKRRIATYYAEAESTRQWDGSLRQTQIDHRNSVAGLLTPVQERLVRRDEPVPMTKAEALDLLARARERQGLKNILSLIASMHQRLEDDALEDDGLAKELKAEIEVSLRR